MKLKIGNILKLLKNPYNAIVVEDSKLNELQITKTGRCNVSQNNSSIINLNEGLYGYSLIILEDDNNGLSSVTAKSTKDISITDGYSVHFDNVKFIRESLTLPDSSQLLTIEMGIIDDENESRFVGFWGEFRNNSMILIGGTKGKAMNQMNLDVYEGMESPYSFNLPFDFTIENKNEQFSLLINRKNVCTIPFVENIKKPKAYLKVTKTRPSSGEGFFGLTRVRVLQLKRIANTPSSYYGASSYYGNEGQGIGGQLL